MFTLLRRSTPKRVRPGSSIRLRLESLECREQPDGLLGDPPTPAPSLEPVPIQNPPPLNMPPSISNFNAEEIGNGLYIISGMVTDETPEGMIVTLGGSTSASGITIIVESDGSFSCMLQLATDGSDTGTISATTSDAYSLESEEVYVFVSPTPP